MDRQLDPKTIKARRRRTIIRIAVVAGAAVGLLFLLSSLLSPSIGRDEISTSVVIRGPIDGSISATGTVLPQFERTIASPAESRLLEVLRKAGSAVRKDDRILVLDQSELNLALERTTRELNINANRKNQLKLDMERTLDDLRGQLNIKTLRLEYLHSKTLQGEKMLEIGAISADQMNQMRLEENISSIEKTDLEKSIASTQLSLQNQLDGVTTVVDALLKEKADILRQVDLIGCRASQDGVVTWTIDQVGSGIRRGDVVARIADLSSYRVEASLSDVHAERLKAGMRARIRVNDETAIPGRVETVYPNVENGAIRVAVALDEPSNPRLRPNLRVDVSLVTSTRDAVLKVKRGAFLRGGEKQEVFVLRGGTAVKTEVTVGVFNDREVEITGGLAEGDEIITSDMQDYLHLSTITVH